MAMGRLTIAACARRLARALRADYIRLCKWVASSVGEVGTVVRFVAQNSESQQPNLQFRQLLRQFSMRSGA